MKNNLERIGYEVFEESDHNPLEIGVPQNRLRLFVGLVHKKFKKN
jgi:site-specific DNA-cytosine methylase